MKKNEIINAAVKRTADWKSKLSDERTMFKEVLSRERAFEQADTVMGLPLNSFIGHFFSGNKELYEKAKDENEVYEKEGLWYVKMKVEKTTDTVRDTKKFAKKASVHEDAYTDVIQGVLEDMKNEPAWLDVAKTASSSKAIVVSEPSDEQMQALQESFDAITRMTLAIKKMATEIMGSCGKDGLDSESAKNMARRGLQLLKDLVPPSETIEEFLVTDRCDLLAKSVQGALEKARGPYKRIMDFYDDLLTIYQKRGGKMSRKNLSL